MTSESTGVRYPQSDCGFRKIEQPLMAAVTRLALCLESVLLVTTALLHIGHTPSEKRTSKPLASGDADGPKGGRNWHAGL